MSIIIIGAIAEALKLVNLMLEGTPLEVRKANATVWFLLLWPLGQKFLKLAGVSDAELAAITAAVKGGGKPA